MASRRSFSVSGSDREQQFRVGRIRPEAAVYDRFELVDDRAAVFHRGGQLIAADGEAFLFIRAVQLGKMAFQAADGGIEIVPHPADFLVQLLFVIEVLRQAGQVGVHRAENAPADHLVQSPRFDRDHAAVFLHADLIARFDLLAAVDAVLGEQALPCDKPELDSAHVVDGVPCKTAFARLREHVAQYTPEWQEPITGVPADVAVRLTDEYVAAPNAYIFGALGLRYQNQGESYRSFYLLGALTGNLGRPGAGVTSEMLPAGFPMVFNDQPITMPEGRENYKGKLLRQAEFIEQVKTQKPYPIKAFWVIAGNPVHNCPNRGLWLNEIFPQMELIVDIDIWMTDTGEYADYVLPDCMPFERYELVASAAYNHIVLQEPAIEPIGEAKDPTFVYSELAKRVGLGEYFDKTAEEWIDIRIQSKWPMIAGIQPPLTYERLKEEKLVRAATPPVNWDPFMGMQFDTPHKRMEFYCERLVCVDDAIAKYLPPLEAPTPTALANGTAKGKYHFFSGRQRFFMQSMFTDDPVMAGLSGGKPTGRMNPIDAEAEGIKDGDMVEVYNGRGHVVIEMKLDQVIPPGTVQVWFGWRHEAFDEGMYSELIVPLGSFETIDDRAENWVKCVEAIGGYQPGFGTGGIGGMAGAWDTIWDCACDVRKVEA